MIKIIQHKPYHNKYKIEFEFKFFDQEKWRKDDHLAHTREAAVDYLYNSKRSLLLHNYDVYLLDRSAQVIDNPGKANTDKHIAFEKCAKGARYWSDHCTDFLDICEMIVVMEPFMLELSGTSGQSFGWLCEIIKFCKHEIKIEGGRIYVPSE